MKITRIFILLLATLAPISALANSERLVSIFETYCLKQTENAPMLDREAFDKMDKRQSKIDTLKGNGDQGYFIASSGGNPYLIEWSGETCRVSTNGALPNDVMKALATNHILTFPHGDNINFGRAHWFEADHALTRYVFTHDLDDSTILLEYHRDDATTNGPVAITFTR